jgi:hypothetical protein
MLELSKEVTQAYPEYILRKLRAAETETDRSIDSLMKELLG